MGKTTKKTTADNADEAVIETPAKAADPAEKAEDAKALKPAKARRTKKADAEKAADSEKEKPAKRKKKAEAEASDDAEKPAKAKKAKKEKAEKPKKAKASKKAAAAQEEDSDENEFSDDVDSIDPDDLAEADDISVDDSDEDAAEVDAWQEGKVSDDDAGTDGDGVREPGAQPKNGYGELVRLGRTRGWVTLADINDYLPESALRTSENLQEVTEQLGRLGIQVFETPPDEDDILINGMGGDTGDDIDEDDAAVMLTPEESAERLVYVSISWKASWCKKSSRIERAVSILSLSPGDSASIPTSFTISSSDASSWSSPISLPRSFIQLPKSPLPQPTATTACRLLPAT